MKGITLKDEEWNVSIKEGAVILMLGTKDEVPLEPSQEDRPKFIEDMNESELATAVRNISNYPDCSDPVKCCNCYILQLEVPAGLTNLGNTCYMNAVVQCLKAVPELRDSLKRYKEEFPVTSLASAQSITAAMRSVFDQMTGTNTVTPILLLQTLHMTFPQFAQTGENGGYRQQVKIINNVTW